MNSLPPRMSKEWQTHSVPGASSTKKQNTKYIHTPSKLPFAPCSKYLLLSYKHVSCFCSFAYHKNLWLLFIHFCSTLCNCSSACTSSKSGVTPFVAATLNHKTVNIIFVPPNFVLLQFLRVDQDKECNMECSGTPRKPLCASDGRTFTSRCEFLRAKCRDPQLEVTRGPCKG